MSFSAAVLQDNPIAYWRLGESSGINAVDETGINNAIYHDTVVLDQPGLLVGDPDRCIRLNAAGAVTKNALSGGAVMSVEALIKPASISEQDIVAVYINDTTRINLFLSSNATLGLWVAPPSGTLLSSSFQILVNQTYHVVLESDGTTTQFYINGALQSNVYNGNLLGQVSPYITVGAYYYGGVINTRWDGFIDEVAIYPTALGAQRVADHYQASITAPQLAAISGNVTIDGINGEALLRAYRRDTGALASETNSDAGTGEYSLAGLDEGIQYDVICIDGSGTRPLVHGPILPV